MSKHFRKYEENITTGMIIVGVVIIAILVTTLITFLINAKTNKSNYIEEQESIEEAQNNDDDEYEIVSTTIGKNVNEASNETNTLEQNSIKENNTQNTEKKTETKKQNVIQKKEIVNPENTKKEETKKEEIKFSAPVKGKILRDFARDSLVYSDTLQEWVTHNGVDIKADKTAVVTAAAKGKVYAIKNDPRYGLTVIINHDDGYQTIYANLLTAEYIVEGEKVEAGQTIGTVGKTATFEFSDEYHLHFELLKDNNYLNPTTYTSFE